MNNVIMRKKVLDGGAYSPISATPLVGTFDITAGLGNTAAVLFKNDLNEDIAWSPGEFHQLAHCDLSKVLVRGALNDVVTAIGDTRTNP